MRRSLAVGCLIAIAVLLVDVGYWGWLLSTTPEASDLPHWQEVLNELSAYGGLALFALVALVVLAHLGVQAVRGGSRARGAWHKRRELNDLLRAYSGGTDPRSDFDRDGPEPLSDFRRT